MSKSAFVPSRNMLGLFTILAGLALPVTAAADARVSENYGKLPLQFEANRGQTHNDVRFLSRGPGYSLYLTAGEAVLVLTRQDPDAKLDSHDAQARPDVKAQAKAVALRMSLVGAARKPLVSGLEELPGKANYFVGKDPAKWRTNVPTYAKVHYQNVYPGIDLVYYGNQRQLEYDFVVAPGADPEKIVLGFQGSDRLEVNKQGDLVLHTAGGAIHQHKPVIYQEIDGIRREIDGGYVLKSGQRVGFKVAAYDRSRPLVIDPVLSYSTYLGSTGNEWAYAIAVDAAGNAYVTGYTNWIDFPTTASPVQKSFAGQDDAFVTKLNSTGSALVYSTYLGGSGADWGQGIAVDADGNAYVTGFTESITFPTSATAFQLLSGGGRDAFVTKLNPTGSALVYSTYLGGTESDWGHGIAVDSAGGAFVTGSTLSGNFPTTAGAFQRWFGGGDPTGGSAGLAGLAGLSGVWSLSVLLPTLQDTGGDAFVTRLNPIGSALVYSTYLGSSGNDMGLGIALDTSENAYVTGASGLNVGSCPPLIGCTKNDFPTTTGALQPSYGGGDSDAFVTKLNSAGSTLVYSTFLGRTGADQGFGIAVDAFRNAYVTGFTFSSNFPTTAGAFRRTLAGESDVFVTKLNGPGSGLLYSTYIGGSGFDAGHAVAVDANGNAYVTGFTLSNNFPTAAAVQGTLDGFEDAFVTKLNPNGSGLIYSTYLGGGVAEAALGIALDTSGGAYVAGVTSSSNFPTTPGAFQDVFAGSIFTGNYDAFVSKITD